MRPEIDAETLERYEKEAEELLANPPPEIKRIYEKFGELPEIKATFKEIMLAGSWLREQLEKRNCPKEKLSPILFAAGQRAVGSDPWEAAKKTLAKYEAGQPEMPGPDLDKTIKEERLCNDKRQCCYKKF